MHSSTISDRSSQRLSISVFCGARPGPSVAGLRAAQSVGQLLGDRGHRLIYGAGGIGIMGEVAHAAARAGASITGVVPRFLYERERNDAAPDQEIVITEGLQDRKAIMIERADAFLALPGGYGTVDEVFDVIGMSYLGLVKKPLVLLDVEGFWSSFVDLTAHLHSQGFADRGLGRIFHLARSPQDAIRLLESPTADLESPPLLAAVHTATGRRSATTTSSLE